MQYTKYLTRLLSSVPNTVTPSSQMKLIRRLENEGIRAFASGLGEAYDFVLENLSSTGYLPTVEDRIPFVPKGTFLASADPGNVLDVLGMFSKLSVAGYKPLAPWDSFLSRSTEVNNFCGCDWEVHLPKPLGYKKWIRRKLGPAPTLIFCKHGPGATAEKLRSWDKWLPFVSEQSESSRIRMVSVPKDFTKDRLIGIEPVRAQFCQQGCANALRATPYFKSWIDLENQDVHADKACISGMRTIDMKDASDRIPLSLVEYLLPSDWYHLLISCSTGYADLPSGEVVRLGMFATMGDGFCFEVETLVFHLVASLLHASGSVHELDHGCGRIAVYGDDIVLPEYLFPPFEAFCAVSGWQMSTKKTMMTDRFKETVGYWIFNGRKRKRFLPKLAGTNSCLEWQSSSEVLDLACRAYSSGYGQLAAALVSGIHLPVRWAPNGMQRWEVRVSKSKTHTRPLSITEEIRYLAYWKCGLSDQHDEDCGDTPREVNEWVPCDTFAPWIYLVVDPSRPVESTCKYSIVL